MKHTIWMAILFASMMISCTGTMEKQERQPSSLTYQNPIIYKNLPDPFLHYEDSTYYLFSTGKAEDGRYIPIHKSKDLVSWKLVRGAVSNGKETDWNYKHFWAPEVIKIDGLYYLYYTASPDTTFENTGNRVGVAVADQVEGPYENKGVVIPHGSIDGHPYIDDQGQMYIFYTIEYGNIDGLKAGQIYVDKLLDPFTVAGEPVQLIHHHKWQEGPFLLHRNNLYFLTYSCGAWTNATYHVRYALGKHPMGPFEEQPDTVIHTNEMVKGPGHHSIFQSPSGKDWMIYHGWDTAFQARYPRIDPMHIAPDSVGVRGPTYTPQPIPK